MLIVLEEDKCNPIRTTVMFCMLVGIISCKDGVKSQQSKQQLAEKVWGLEWTADARGASSVMQLLIKKRGKKRQTSYWDRSLKVQCMSCEIILLFYSA